MSEEKLKDDQNSEEARGNSMANWATQTAKKQAQSRGEVPSPVKKGGPIQMFKDENLWGMRVSVL